MRNSIRSLLLAFGLLAVLPTARAIASDDPKTEAKAEKKGDTKDAKKADVDPVKRLVEMRLDAFVVAAKAINLPLPGRVKTTQEILDQFEKMAKDDQVGAILLDLDGLGLSLPDIEELRAGIKAFRASGKKVKAYMNTADPNSYLVACAADEIVIAPCGMLAIPGLGRLFPYMRGMYQLQGIEYDVITAGEFKYPGFVNRREPPEPFLVEFNAILDSWFKDYVTTIAEGRKLTEEKVKELIDMAILEPENARNYGLIDHIAYYEDYRDQVLRREKLKKGSGDGSDFSKITSLQDLFTQVTREIAKAQESYKAVGPKIAVLHARGPIVDISLGAVAASQMIMRDDFVKTVEEIRKNKTIRAVVLHIDSPGGSAYASDVIYRKLKELDDEKPVVVSMGSVAGSGGYYIAAPARLIFAQPTTITGSIGVIGMLANQASALNRMDVNMHEMKRGERSLLGMGHRDLTPEDRKVIEDLIMDTYEQFLDRVAEGRKMPKKEVRKIAGGRIYTGRDALDIGLVDRLGGLNDAIAAVRDMADIPKSAEVKIVHYPRPSSLGELAESLFGLQAMLNAVEMAQTPATPIPFESQVRFFGRVPQPLCWMAMPDVWTPSLRGDGVQAALDLMGLQPALRPAAGLLP